MSTFTIVCELAMPASRLWTALKNFHLIFPNLAPGTGDNMQVIEGAPGEAGSITLTTFGATAGVPSGAFAKEKILTVDEDNLSIDSAEIEGGHLALGFRKWQSSTKLYPLTENKVKLELIINYEGDSGPVCDMALEQTKEGLPLMFKGAELYILSQGLFTQ